MCVFKNNSGYLWVKIIWVILVFFFVAHGKHKLFKNHKLFKSLFKLQNSYTRRLFLSEEQRIKKV